MKQARISSGGREREAAVNLLYQVALLLVVGHGGEVTLELDGDCVLDGCEQDG